MWVHVLAAVFTNDCGFRSSLSYGETGLATVRLARLHGDTSVVPTLLCRSVKLRRCGRVEGGGGGVQVPPGGHPRAQPGVGGGQVQARRPAHRHPPGVPRLPFMRSRTATASVR